MVVFLSLVQYFLSRASYNGFFILFSTDRIHDPSSNLEEQCAVLTKTPEQLSELLNI